MIRSLLCVQSVPKQQLQATNDQGTLTTFVFAYSKLIKSERSPYDPNANWGAQALAYACIFGWVFYGRDKLVSQWKSGIRNIRTRLCRCPKDGQIYRWDDLCKI